MIMLISSFRSVLELDPDCQSEYPLTVNRWEVLLLNPERLRTRRFPLQTLWFQFCYVYEASPQIPAPSKGFSIY